MYGQSSRCMSSHCTVRSSDSSRELKLYGENVPSPADCWQVPADWAALVCVALKIKRRQCIWTASTVRKPPSAVWIFWHVRNPSDRQTMVREQIISRRAPLYAVRKIRLVKRELGTSVGTRVKIVLFFFHFSFVLFRFDLSSSNSVSFDEFLGVGLLVFIFSKMLSLY